MLIDKSFGEFPLASLQFAEGQFGGVQRTRDLRVEVAANNAAQCDSKHDPEGNAGKALELERCVVCDHDRSRDTGDDMKVHPVTCGAPAAQPGSDLAQFVEKDDEEERCAENAEFKA